METLRPGQASVPGCGRSRLPVLIAVGLVAAGATYSAAPAVLARIAGSSSPSSIAKVTQTPVSLASRNPTPLLRQKRAQTAVDQVANRFDPSHHEGWDTEVLAKAAGAQLEVLAKLLKHPHAMEVKHVSKIVAESFACQPLRPAKLIKAFHDGIISVRRPQSDSEAPNGAPTQSYRSSRGLVAALRHLTAALGEEENIRVKFKDFRISKAENHFTTQSYFEAHNRTAHDSVQLNAIWTCTWTYPKATGPDKPRLLSIAQDQFEVATVSIAGGSLFTDCTESAVGANPSYQQQVLRGINHWKIRLSSVETILTDAYHGLAVGDVNGDGLEDVYLCEMGGLPNRLYVQNRDGTVRDVSAEAGVDWLDYTASTLLIDLDNDGDQDMIVAARPVLMIAENDGAGHFVVRSTHRVVDRPQSMCAADYDMDGDLDFYVCAYGRSLTDPARGPTSFYDAKNGGRNALMRNDGDFKFVDVTDEIGLDADNSRFSFAAAWEDYDNDGDLDLYVANDFARNNLYRNDQGRFAEIAELVAAEDVAGGMSVTWGDYNRDGHVDVYVGNMFSGAGNRITRQDTFTHGRTVEETKLLQRYAKGNTLLANCGDGTFRDVSFEAAVTMGRWAWSSNFLDLNNDGWLDLVVANGFITTEDTGDL